MFNQPKPKEGCLQYRGSQTEKPRAFSVHGDIGVQGIAFGICAKTNAEFSEPS